MFYTTSFKNLEKLPKNIVPISIARNSPANWEGFEYKGLAPSIKVLNEYHQTRDIEKFTKDYIYETLMVRDPDDVAFDLQLKCQQTAFRDIDIVLVCHEDNDEVCHRHLVADWLRNAGYDIIEYAIE